MCQKREPPPALPTPLPIDSTSLHCRHLARPHSQEVQERDAFQLLSHHPSLGKRGEPSFNKHEHEEHSPAVRDIYSATSQVG